MSTWKKGFTVFELMIAVSTMLIAMVGISFVYLSSERLMKSGIGQIDAQKKSQLLAQRFSRWIRSAGIVTVINGGDGMQIQTPVSIDPVAYVTSEVNYMDGVMYYDSDITDDVLAVQIEDGIYKLEGANMFSTIGNDFVVAKFGAESELLYGSRNFIDTSIKVKMRNAAE